MRPLLTLLFAGMLLLPAGSHAQTPLFEKPFLLGDSLANYMTYYPMSQTLKNGNTVVAGNGLSFHDSLPVIDSAFLYIKLFDEDADLLRDTMLLFDHFILLDITATGDSGFAVCGHTDSATIIIRFDAGGIPGAPVVAAGTGKTEIVRELIEDEGSYYLFSFDHTFKSYDYVESYYPYFPTSYQYYYFETGQFLSKIGPDGQLTWRSLLDTSATLYINSSLFIMNPIPVIDTSDYFSDYDLLLFLISGSLWPDPEHTQYYMLRQHPETGNICLITIRSELQKDAYGNDMITDLEQKYFTLDSGSGSIMDVKALLENEVMEAFPYWAYLVYPLDSSLLMRGNSYYNNASDTLIMPYYNYDYDGVFIDSAIAYDPENTPLGPEAIFGSWLPFRINRDDALTGIVKSDYYYDPDQDESGYRPRLFINTYNDRLEQESQHWGFVQTEIYTLRDFSPTSDGHYLVLGQLNDPSVIQTQLVFVKIRGEQNDLRVTTYIDNNGNNTYDNGDAYFTAGKLEIRNTEDTYLVPLSPGGESWVGADSGRNTLKLISHYQRLNAYTIEPDSVVLDFVGFGNTDSLTFRLVPKSSFHDLQVSIIPNQRAPRPGFASAYTIQAGNYGTQTENNIRLTFLKDTRQTYDPSTLDDNSFSDDTVIWIIDSLPPIGTMRFPAGMINAVPPGLDLGDTTLVQATIQGEAADSFLKDNVFYLYEPVVNSFDPNDKLEAHGSHITNEQLQSGEYLYYTIRFQNTGTDYAYRVLVQDTLSPNLDPATLQMIAASHYGYRFEVDNRHILTWTFDNIYLPDSTSNEPGSHGFITFRIKPSAGLTVNDVISNRAYIYFDFNAPVVTNTVMTSIIDERVTVVRENEFKTVKLYPSPTSGQFQLEAEILGAGQYTLRLTSLSGQVILSETRLLSPGLYQKQVSLDGLPNGMYLVALQAASGTVYQGCVIKQ